MTDRDELIEQVARAIFQIPDGEAVSRPSRLAAERAIALLRADEPLPCDVQIPGALFRRGVKLSTLLLGIRRRAGWPEADTKLDRLAAVQPKERGNDPAH